MLASSAVPHDSAGGIVVLVDASAIIVVDEGLGTRASHQGAVEMSDSPTGDARIPTSTMAVSLWQNDSAALLVERRLNWARGREGAVAWLSDVAWGSV